MWFSIPFYKSQSNACINEFIIVFAFYCVTYTILIYIIKINPPKSMMAFSSSELE